MLQTKFSTFGTDELILHFALDPESCTTIPFVQVAFKHLHAQD